ncbi:MAG: alpha/beta fold hydrolase [Oligoflexia bacterium]|nr:alpha/beta fold hydrolase [Oligoflexia bacterium]
MTSHFLLLIVLLVSSVASHAAPCGNPWRNSKGPGCDYVQWGNTYVRAGYVLESAQNKFLGNVLYFEGLGDSMLNHLPLFNSLSKAGFRVIAFDYPGQGGSLGSMDNTNISDIVKAGSELLYLYGRDVQNSQKIIIGWSTGGLAAYFAAYLGHADKIVLLNPSIVPRIRFGGGFRMQITLKNLTSQSYLGYGIDPHIEEIKPNSPLNVPLFAAHLLATSYFVRNLKIAPHVQGLVLLSGRHDRFIDPTSTQDILEEKAPHFEFHSFPEAFHELDNEREPVNQWVRNEIIKFLN